MTVWSVDYGLLPDATYPSVFDTGQTYTASYAGTGSRAAVLYGTLVMPGFATPGACYEFANASLAGEANALQVEATFQFWSVLGSTSGATVALGMFDSPLTGPLFSPAHLVFTAAGAWYLTGYYGGSPIAVASGSWTVALDTWYTARITLDRAAGTVTVLLPDGTSHTYSHPLVASTNYPVGFWEMTCAATTDRPPRISKARALTVPAQATTVVPWQPSLQQVADLVPNRTVNQGLAAAASPVINGTFTAATIPTGAQVDRLIGQAVSWVAARTGTVTPSLYGDAQAVTAMRTAGLIQTAYPVSDASYSYGGQGNAGDDVGARWFALADAALTALVAANLAAGGGAGSTGGTAAAVVGSYSFPLPPVWGDQLLL